MEAKDRVYQALCRMSKSDCQITAAALAEELNLSRQVVSHYLNRLLEEGSVEKTLTPAGMLEYQETTERECAGFCQ